MRALIAGLAFALCASAIAKPIAFTVAGSQRVTLYTEPCALKNIINLPQRAVWTDESKKKDYEGCWGSSQFGVVVTYWDDGSVEVIPFDVFAKVGSDS